LTAVGAAAQAGAVPDTPAAPRPEDVDAIAALADPVLRNLRITHAYGRLSTALRARLCGDAGDGAHANWCTFATWASRQAGSTIRGEDLRAALERAADEALGGRHGRAVIDALRGLGVSADRLPVLRELRAALGIDEAARRAADAVARGNLKVFAEIGRVFACFLEEAGRPGPFDRVRLDGFLATLHPGDPPEGQRLLARAFARYHAALGALDPDARAELLLLANLEIGIHEQTRLQPEIREALDAALPDSGPLAGRLLGALLPWGGWWARARVLARRVLRRPVPLDRALEALVAQVSAATRAALTEHLMVLELARGVRVRLGRDLPGTFPPTLRGLENPDLLALLSRVDPTPDSVAGTGARDWSDLAQRMHFIADLFRSRHASVELFDPPFGVDEVALIEAGRVPPELRSNRA
jgi:hypothetical protein